MRLRRLAISGIGPFRGEEVIDFDVLTRSGLFLIEGPTGAGKSTIIDAITYALYGSVAGGRESTTDRIRSDLAEASTPSYVELEFDVAGTTYLVRRQPAYSRPKLRGAGMIKENPKQFLRALDDSLEPITDAREIAVQVQRLLGLSVEHFRKLVVLPQGEFDALLRSSPADRFEVLGRLIDDGFIESVQEDLVLRGRDAEARRTEVRARIHEISTMLCSRAAEALDDVAAATDLDEDALATTVTALQARVDQARGVAESLTAPAAAAMQAAGAAEAELARAEAGAAALAALAAARTALPEAMRDLPPDQLRQRRSETAASIGRLEPFAAWEIARTERSERTAELIAAALQARHEMEAVRQQAEELPGQRSDCERQRQDAVALAASLQQHATEVQRLGALVAAADELKAREAEHAAASAAVQAANDKAERCRAATLSAREERVRLLEQRLAHSAADLAARLSSGDPCPVCGSPDHPAIARDVDGVVVSEGQIDEAEAAVARAETAESVAASAADTARSALAQAQSHVDGLRGRLDGIDVDGLAESLTAAEAALAQAGAASTTVDALTARLAEIDAKAASLNDSSAAASAALAQAEALVNADAERVAQEEAALRETVGGDGTATDLLEAARIAAGAIDTALDAAEAAAAHAGCDGISDLQMRARTARESATALGEQLERAREDHARLSATRDAVQALAEQWRAAHADVAGILAATDTAVSLGQLVSAQSKANTRRLTLQSYAVQRRFRTVLDAATLHLERMSGSHFAFELDESVGRGQSGLGIAMRDQWSGALRDPKALSGGETFIASLALALGLADVVREENGGVDLQTLFVDEGFGSLDQGSLQQVLDQLDALRSRGRVVGVISHVTEMKDWVHDRVIVTPGTPGEGSRLHQPT